jgi:hypothetical protein
MCICSQMYNQLLIILSYDLETKHWKYQTTLCTKKLIFYENKIPEFPLDFPYYYHQLIFQNYHFHTKVI